MSTVTPKTRYDPDDSTIENSLQLLEKKLRFWSPIALGSADIVMPFTLTGAVGLSTILGYCLFFLPAFLAATIIADFTLGATIFTTLTTIATGATALPSLITAQPLATIAAFTVLYTALVLSYNPETPNGAAVSEVYEWQKLIHSAYICTPLAVGSAAYAIITATPLAFIATVGASWWLLRRLTFTVIWDETRYIVDPPYAEVLISTRVPFGVGVLAIILGVSTLGGLALLTAPFIATPLYLNWRASQGSDDTQELGTLRMHERSGLSQDIVEDFSPSNAYKANANDDLIRPTVEKFNSFLETEVDTETRLHLPDGRLTRGEIRNTLAEAERIHTQFREVSYRPERFDDLVNELQTYGEQYIEVLEDEGVN